MYIYIQQHKCIYMQKDPFGIMKGRAEKGGRPRDGKVKIVNI